MPDLAQITHRHAEAFNAVLHVGSFTKAARLLRSSQPSISRLMKELQEAVGFVLFTRSDGRTVATPEAIALHQEVERSFVGLERISERAAQIKERRVEQLRIVSMPALAHTFLPVALAGFLKDRPSVAAAIQAQRSESIASWVSTQQFDVGFAMLPMDKPGVEIELFDPAIGVCVMPADHPLAMRTEIIPQDLDGMPFIGKGAGSFMSRSLQQVLDDAKVRCDVRVETPIAAIACQMVMQGLGLTIADPFTAKAFEPLGLVSRPFRPAIAYNFGVLYPSHRLRSQLVSDFVAYLHLERQKVHGKRL
ncbi:LysR substrate-binding domain-containing protein [Bosea sp. 2KB_26]|uniref:LysR substrate-binding domain-containing protein n=1 Tax=Bosea sp. 2KB_26 TaxID=3237475 RepID=UPI003F8F1DD9